MPFSIEKPDYTELLKNAYDKLNPYDKSTFREGVEANVDAYGRYSYTLCCLWRDSAAIPLEMVPHVINSIPKLDDEGHYTMSDIMAQYRSDKARYDTYDTYKGATKGLTSRVAAGTDMLCLAVTGELGYRVPPFTVKSIKNDADHVFWMCRRNVTHEPYDEFDRLMGGGGDE